MSGLEAVSVFSGYIAMMGLWVFIGYYSMKGMSRLLYVKRKAAASQKGESHEKNSYFHACGDDGIYGRCMWQRQ